ncbi:hypothetical protein [Mycobacterium sp. SMC-15]|uniref:hypothetical protein n=1 Tax=Mycobacterium sp. SMC-15 TaxID=3381627 RepID=UPI0038778CCC
MARELFERSDDDDPINWAEMFGAAGQRFTRVAIEDVPELCSAIDEVVEEAARDQNFCRRLNPFHNSDDAEWREGQLRFDYRKFFVSEIIARAEATGVDSDDALLDIYLQLERARFLDVLGGDLVVPLVLTDVGVHHLELNSDVYIEEISKDLHCARAPHVLYSGEVSGHLTAAATHAIVVRDLRVDNSDYSKRRLASLYGISVVDPREIAKVDQVIQAIHIVSGAPTGYTQVLIRPHNWADCWTADLPAVYKAHTYNHYPKSNGFEPEWRIPREPLNESAVAEIIPAFSALSSAPKNVGVAARRAIRAMMRTDDEDRTLDSMIGIEALLLDNQAELSFRMALRAAAALSSEFDPAMIFALAKKVYDHRSEIAHGATPKKATFTHAGTTWRSADIAPSLLRALLRNYLLASNPWTKEDLDNRVLAALSAYQPEAADANGTDPGGSSGSD